MHPDHVRLTIPASAGFARLARLTAASVAGRAGFGYDEVEDVRIAVSEACALLLDDPTAGVLRVDLTVDEDELRVAISRGASDRSPEDPPQLSVQILDAVVDRHAVRTAGDGSTAIELAKRRPPRD